MLISYSRPSPITWSLNGAGSAFLTSSSRLANGRPNSATRIQWLSGTQTTSSVLRLRGSWVGSSPVNVYSGLLGLVGITLRVGTRIVASVYSGGNWALNPVEGRVQQRKDGVRVAWFVMPTVAYPQDGVQCAIYNDVNGTAFIPADSTFEIGEVWAGASSEWRIKTDLDLNASDLSKNVVSLGGQPFPVRRRAVKRTQFTMTPKTYAETFTATPSVDDLREDLLGLQPAVVCPMTAAPFTGATSIDTDYLHRHAQFGYFSTVGPITGQAPRFMFSGQFDAPPAWLPEAGAP